MAKIVLQETETKYPPRSIVPINVKKFRVIDDIYIKTSDRIAVFGRSGSGKTNIISNYLIPYYDSYTFWDVKTENDKIPHDIVATNSHDFVDVINKYDRILYQPEDPGAADFDNICKIIFNHKNHCLIVDEASRISNPSSIPYWLNVIMTQGRTSNVGIINAAQRPKSIHNTMISEANHLFIFSLNLDTDIDKLREMIGSAADNIRLLPEFHFIYFNMDLHKAFIFRPISDTDDIEYTEEGGIKNKMTELKLWQPTLKEYLRLIKSRST